MSSLLTTAQIANATGSLGDHFDTFSRNITIFKAPIAVLSSQSATMYPGYGNISNYDNIQSYTAVYQVFPAIVRFVGEQNSDMIQETKTTSPGTALARIKVKQDCKNYIEMGKTEYVLIDDVKFNIHSEVAIRNFLGLKYYEYWIVQTS